MAVSTDYITTGGGKLFIEMYVAGVLTGNRAYFGVTEGVSLSTEAEYLEHKNTETSVASTDKKVQKSQSANLAFSTAEISPAMMGRAFSGVVTDKIQAIKTAEAVVLASVDEGYSYDIGIYGITDLVVQDATDTTTYVEGADYSVDTGAGLITILEGGAITGGVEIHLAVTAPAYTGGFVASLRASSIEARLTFISDPLVGKRYKYTFKKVSISAEGDFALKGTKAWKKFLPVLNLKVNLKIGYYLYF